MPVRSSNTWELANFTFPLSQATSRISLCTRFAIISQRWLHPVNCPFTSKMISPHDSLMASVRLDNRVVQGRNQRWQWQLVTDLVMWKIFWNPRSSILDCNWHDQESLTEYFSETGILKFYEFCEFSDIWFNLTSHGLNIILCKLSNESLKWNSWLLDISCGGKKVKMFLLISLNAT